MFPQEQTSFRVWRNDEGALVAGVCAGLAQDLDLPLPMIRLVAVLFAILPGGLAYLALGLLLRRRSQATPNPRAASGVPLDQEWSLLRHRLSALEPRVGRMESFVTSSEFELHRGFRQMGG